MNCPVCNVALVMSERQGVEIDYCPQCRGIWLDRGELDKIIERSAQETFRTQPQDSGHRDSHHGKHGGHHDDYHHKKKRNFLSELFD